MAIRKIGSPEKIHTITTALQFDLNLAVKKIKDTHKRPNITIDELHEALKALGITNYSSEDMSEIHRLLKSVGISVQ